MVARVMGPSVTQKLGQPFVIDNRSGATGAIGAALVKRAAPDGYTILIASIGVYAINPFLQKGLQYDPAKDFDLLTVAVRAPNVLVVNPAMPAKNVQEFIGHLKKMPGKVTFASSGAGSSDHLTAALFWQKTGTSGLHVPYKGGAPAITDLLGGHADSSFQNINAILPHVQAGKMKALGITSEKRSPVLPNVPTMAEGGVKDVEVYSWQAAAAPKGLPKDRESHAPRCARRCAERAAEQAEDDRARLRSARELAGILREVPESGARALESGDRHRENHARVTRSSWRFT